MTLIKFGGGGGGGQAGLYGSIPYVIPITMEVPEGTVAYPDIDALTVGTAKKISGMVFP
jgi:hypothetical protein